MKIRESLSFSLSFSIFYFIVDDLQPWMLWGYYVSPMMYGQNAIVINEFLDDRWSAVSFLSGSKNFVYRKKKKKIY